MTRARDDSESADPFGAFVSRVAHPQSGGGPLAGLRLAVKDNIAVKGEPFTAGLPLYANRIAHDTAPAVRRLLDAGAAFAGMTRTDSGGFGVTTPDVENPVLPGRSVGGSSGGNAATLAANLADIALGTDTGGSVRIPAACCGLVGYKPSLGAIPREGVALMAPSFDTVGLMARDMETLLRAAAGLPGTAIPGRPDTALRLGVDRARLANDDPAVAAAFGRALALLERHGATIHPVTLPDRERVIATHGIVVLAETRELYKEAWSKTPQLFPETARRALAAAQDVTADMLEAARAELDRIRQDFDTACAGLDAVATPTLIVSPPPRGAHRVALRGREISVIAAMIAETCLANATGGPAISLPCTNAAGHFASLQLAAPRGHDARLLATAARLSAIVAAGVA